jgi:hypothetical protein
MTSCREALCLHMKPRQTLPFSSDRDYVRNTIVPAKHLREPGPITTGLPCCKTTAPQVFA